MLRASSLRSSAAIAPDKGSVRLMLGIFPFRLFVIFFAVELGKARFHFFAPAAAGTAVLGKALQPKPERKYFRAHWSWLPHTYESLICLHRSFERYC
jgi:hypothetical protein